MTDKGIGAALGTAIAAVFALLTVGGHGVLVKLATEYFSWTAVLLSGYFIFSRVMAIAHESDRKLLEWGKIGCLIGGGVCWQQGAIAAVEYIGVSPLQGTLLHVVFVSLVTLATFAAIRGTRAR